MSKNKSVNLNNARAAFASFAAICADNAAKAAERFSVSAAAADKRAASTLKAHAHYSEALSALSDAALRYALSVDAASVDTLCNASREAKKRACDVLSAIADKRAMRADTRAAFALFAAKSDKNDFRVSEVQREMQHDTNTQAMYFVRFLVMFNAATFDKETKTVTIVRESKLMRDALATV